MSMWSTFTIFIETYRGIDIYQGTTYVWYGFAYETATYWGYPSLEATRLAIGGLLGTSTPQASYNLAYSSTPINVDSLINGVTALSGSAVSLPAGSTVTIQVPAQVEVEITSTHILLASGGTYSLQKVLTGIITTSASVQTLADTIPNGAVVLVKSGVYLLPSYLGFLVTGKRDITYYGEPNVVFKSAMPTPMKVTQVVATDNSTNVQFYDIAFDMDCFANPNNLPQPSWGETWGVRDAGGVNNKYVRCKVLNVGGSGVVCGGSTWLQMIDCTFDRMNEHTLYIENSSDLHFIRCNFYNFGKLGRGYGPKLVNSHDIYMEDCYHEPNKDGRGYKVWDFDPREVGARGPVLVANYNLFVKRTRWISDSVNQYVYYPIDVECDSQQHNLNFEGCQWVNWGSGPDFLGTTYKSHNQAELHLTNCSFT